MKNNMNELEKAFIIFLKEWKVEKEKEGFIPTIDLLVEELKEKGTK